MKSNGAVLLVVFCAFLAGSVATTLMPGCGSSDSTSPSASPSGAAAPASPGGETAVERADAPAASGVESATASPSSAQSSEAAAGSAGAPALATRPPAVDKSANAPIQPGDWPQWGGTSYRNNTPAAQKIPIQWNVGDFDRKTGQWIPDEAQNIRWVASLGSYSYGNPVVAGGKVFAGTNNNHGYLARYPSDFDLGCLLCFRESDGEFLWQHSSEKLPSGPAHDWPLQGICCAPCVEGDRLWFVTSRGEVCCLDTEGFYDGQDDGPVQSPWGRLLDIVGKEDSDQDELAPVLAALGKGKLSESLRKRFARAGVVLPEETALEEVEAGATWAVSATVGDSPRRFELRLSGPPNSQLSVFQQITVADKQEADVVWTLDMMDKLGVRQHNMAACSVTVFGDLLFAGTSNGVDEADVSVAAPDAPSFLALDKHTGEVVWMDNSPGENILHGQWSSPAAALLGGVPQVLFGGGDGWLYSFRADRGQNGKPELLWRFDCNPKESKWTLDGRGTRNSIIATPVIYDGLVYIAVGQDPEKGEGIGHLWCIDPTGRGDVSAELAVRESDHTQRIPPRRIQAVIPEQGETVIPNPNSAAVWGYSQSDKNGDGTIDFEEEMHRACGSVCIQNDLLFLGDFAGLFHCLDAKTGKEHWTYDMLASTWGSPLIAAGHVFIGDEDGDVSIFRLSADPDVAMTKEEGSDEYLPIAEIRMGNSLYSTPIVANGVLYISTTDKLFAIQASPEAQP